MPGYLDEYGVRDARREKTVKWIVVSVLIVAVGAGLFWLFFRDWREDRQAKRFVQLLRQQDYRAAYELWGCSESHPCKDYPFPKFIDDWGPASGHADPRLEKTFRQGFTQSCTAGVIYNVGFSKGDPVSVWVDRKDKTVGFAPWPSCNPILPPTR